MPEWVQVWAWLRFARQPQCMTPLPQQDEHPEAMTMEDFGRYRDEWILAGRPSLTVSKLVAVMTGEYEELPF